MRVALGLGVALELEGLSGVSCEREALWVRVWRSRCCWFGRERGIDDGIDAVLGSEHARYGGAQ